VLCYSLEMVTQCLWKDVTCCLCELIAIIGAVSCPYESDHIAPTLMTTIKPSMVEWQIFIYMPIKWPKGLNRWTRLAIVCEWTCLMELWRRFIMYMWHDTVYCCLFCPLSEMFALLSEEFIVCWFWQRLLCHTV